MLLGVVGAVAGLVFLAVTGVGADWYGDTGAGWFDGEVWWVAVAGGAGLLVGLLRCSLAMPAKIPGAAAPGAALPSGERSTTTRLGTGLLLATLIAKMFTFAVSSATGFIGGPIFPMLFIGGTAGVIVSILIPDSPSPACWWRCRVRR